MKVVVAVDSFKGSMTSMEAGMAVKAGILAAKIIATNDEALADRLEAYAKNMKETVEKKAAKLESIGYSEYLKQMQSK